MPRITDQTPLPPVAARFARYVQIDTQSDPEALATPSTEKQKDLCRLLVRELRAIGLSHVEMDGYGYVYATLPATTEEHLPVLGLVAHVDTSPDEPGADVVPHLHLGYAGGELVLPRGGVVLDPNRQPALREHQGHDLITSDGSTLLGSDDKAGVAVLMQLAEDLIDDPAPRPEIRLLFTVDEEIGRGVAKLDYKKFGAKVAYTLDGSGRDTIYAETFNAAEATVKIKGVVVHPGYAKGIMANAVRILSEFIAALPEDESPATTSGRQGYYYPHTITQGDTGEAEVRLLLRDFSDEGMAQRKATVHSIAEVLGRRHPSAEVTVQIKDQYRNMLRYIEETDPRAVSFALEAARQHGFEPKLALVRGGTDGARLSEKGIPTPNVFTGGHDFHSRFEWNTVQNLEHALAYTKTLVRYWGENG